MMNFQSPVWVDVELIDSEFKIKHHIKNNYIVLNATDVSKIEGLEEKFKDAEWGYVSKKGGWSNKYPGQLDMEYEYKYDSVSGGKVPINISVMELNNHEGNKLLSLLGIKNDNYLDRNGAGKYYVKYGSEIYNLRIDFGFDPPRWAISPRG